MNHAVLEFFAVPFAKTIISFVILIDPVGLIPIFLGLTGTCNAREKFSAILTACSVLFALMVLFLFVGRPFLELLSISIASFKIGGGILLMLTAISMFNAEVEKNYQSCKGQSLANITIVPFAIPLLFGPALISVLVVYAEKAHSFYYLLGLILCAFISALISALILASSIPLMNKIGQTGFNTINRIMGLIIMAIAVQFCLDGLKIAFPLLDNRV